MADAVSARIMSGVRRKLAALGLAASLLAGTGMASPVAAPMATRACAAMQHPCCHAPALTDCCVIPATPPGTSTPAEARYDLARHVVATPVALGVDGVIPASSAAATPHVLAPPHSPPDLVTLYSSLLI